MNQRLTMAGLFTIAASSCAGSHAEQVRDARLEQIEARADANQERAEAREEARQGTIDRRYDARQQRLEDSQRPGADAQAKLVELSKERTDFRSEMQTRLEKLAIRINAAQSKLQVQGERAPLPLRTELQNVVEQYNLLKNDVTSLDSTPDSGWGAKRSDVERRTGLLDERVEQLDDSVSS